MKQRCQCHLILQTIVNKVIQFYNYRINILRIEACQHEMQQHFPLCSGICDQGFYKTLNGRRGAQLESTENFCNLRECNEIPLNCVCIVTSS